MKETARIQGRMGEWSKALRLGRSISGFVVSIPTPVISFSGKEIKTSLAMWQDAREVLRSKGRLNDSCVKKRIVSKKPHAGVYEIQKQVLKYPVS